MTTFCFGITGETHTAVIIERALCPLLGFPTLTGQGAPRVFGTHPSSLACLLCAPVGACTPMCSRVHVYVCTCMYLVPCTVTDPSSLACLPCAPVGACTPVCSRVCVYARVLPWARVRAHAYVFGPVRCRSSCRSAPTPRSRCRRSPPSTLPFCDHARPCPTGISGNPQLLSISSVLSFQERYTRGITQYWPCGTGFSHSASLEGLPRGVTF